jgi:hypothetical protein
MVATLVFADTYEKAPVDAEVGVVKEKAASPYVLVISEKIERVGTFLETVKVKLIDALS